MAGRKVKFLDFDERNSENLTHDWVKSRLNSKNVQNIRVVYSACLLYKIPNIFLTLPVLRSSKNARYTHRYLFYDVTPARILVREPTSVAFDM